MGVSNNTTDYTAVTIKEQITDTPTNSDSTIMDDTSMQMDGNGLMGGPVTTIEPLQTIVKQDRVFTDIPRNS